MRLTQLGTMDISIYHKKMKLTSILGLVPSEATFLNPAELSPVVILSKTILLPVLVV